MDSKQGGNYMAFQNWGKNITVRQVLELENNIGLDTLEDDTGTFTYIGVSIAGTATSVSEWWIIRITNADNTIKSADLPSGKEDAIMSNEWDERANLNFHD